MSAAAARWLAGLLAGAALAARLGMPYFESSAKADVPTLNRGIGGNNLINYD